LKRLKSVKKPESIDQGSNEPQSEPEMPGLATRRARFFYWLDNVFWYHYKWHVVAVAVLLALTVFFARDILLKTTPDFQFVVASNTYVSNENISDLCDIASETIRNPDSGKPAVVLGQGMHMSEEGQWGMAAYMKMATILMDESIMFFIFDADLLEAFFSESSRFADLAELGYSVVEGKPWLVDVSGLPPLENAGLSGMACYAAIQLPRNTDAELRLPDPNCLVFLDAIIDTQGGEY